MSVEINGKTKTGGIIPVQQPPFQSTLIKDQLLVILFLWFNILKFINNN